MCGGGSILTDDWQHADHLCGVCRLGSLRDDWLWLNIGSEIGIRAIQSVAYDNRTDPFSFDTISPENDGVILH